MNNKTQKTNHGLVTTLKTSRLVTLLLVVLMSSLTIGTLTSVVSTSGLANATTTDDTDSQVGLGFTTTPGPIPTPTPTGTARPTQGPTKAPSPTPTQSTPVIPDPHDPPTANEPTVNVGTNLAKTGWINIQTWLAAFALLGSVFLFWAFLLVRREREEQEEDGLVIVANAGVDSHDGQSAAFGKSGFGLGEDK